VVASGVYYVASVLAPPRETFITQSEMDEVKQSIDSMDRPHGHRSSSGLKSSEKDAVDVDIKEV
jgi:hypothetical protein